MYLALDLEIKEGEEWQQLAKPGVFYHPRVKKPFELSLTHFEGWKKYFHYLSAQGNTIPIVPQHSTDPNDRIGTLEAIKISNGLPYGKIKWKDEKTKEAHKDASVSVFFQHDYMEHDGTKFSSVLLHVGVTDYPVLKGLQKIVAASCFSESDFLSLGYIIDSEPHGPKPDEANNNNNEVKMEKIALALGLTADASEAQVLGKLTALASTVTGLKKKVSEFEKREKAANEARIEKLSISDEQKNVLRTLDSEALEITLSFINTNDESFQTGGQGSGEENDASLLDAMEDLAKEWKEFE